MYDALAVANYFLDLAARDGKTLDPMKIQKLVYFAHGWNLALDNSPLVRERIEAWTYGPVIPSLYRCFKRFGASAIAEPACQDGRTPRVGDAWNCDDTDYVKSLLEFVWRTYGEHSGLQLSTITHQLGTPWEIARRSAPLSPSRPIDDEQIKAYFKREMEAA